MIFCFVMSAVFILFCTFNAILFSSSTEVNLILICTGAILFGMGLLALERRKR